MYFKSFFDEQLAHMSYLIGCQKTGEAIVIDPARNIQPYLKTAEKEHLEIIAASETHIHADYLSGARELAEKLGVKLYLSNEGDQDWKYQYASEYDHQLLTEGSTFEIGKVHFEVLHTPGHTPESISFLLTDKGGGADTPMGIFTGDFLFVGDVGRPDLLEKAAGATGTSGIGAKQMFDSLQKVAKLPDFLQVWPAHGAGSSCGKSLGAVPVSTLGYEKKYNWAFQIKDKDKFVMKLLEGQPEPPVYFAEMKKQNKIGPALLENRTVPKLHEPLKEGAITIDTRAANEFAQNHIPGTLNLLFNRSFTNWAGWLINYEQDIILITNEGQLNDCRLALQSIGLDHVIGYAEPESIPAGLEQYKEISAKQAEQFAQQEDYFVLDVRNQNEWEEGHIPGAHHNMLGDLFQNLAHLPKEKTLITHCASGARSAIAASILQANGFKDVLSLKGGITSWKKEGLPVKL